MTDTHTPGVLDAACGGKMFYFDKDSPDVLYCDERAEEHELCDGRKFSVAPGVLCDFTNMPFSDGVFNLVVFDPPHLKRAGDTSWMKHKYGRLPKDWADYLAKGFGECWRVLRPGGSLIFKWNDTQIKVGELAKCFPVKPLLGQKTTRNLKTHWLVFYKSGSGVLP